jgi:hypothetical protein
VVVVAIHILYLHTTATVTVTFCSVLFCVTMISRTMRTFRMGAGFVRACSTAAANQMPAVPASASEAANSFNRIMFKGRKVRTEGVSE